MVAPMIISEFFKVYITVKILQWEYYSENISQILKSEYNNNCWDITDEKLQYLYYCGDIMVGVLQ